MSEYTMRMHNEHFQNIKKGIKIIEVHLNDKKRDVMGAGDKIIFVNRKDSEIIISKVLTIYKNKSFNNLFKMFDISKTGYTTKKEINEALGEFYTKEQEKKFGVVGIEIKVI